MYIPLYKLYTKLLFRTDDIAAFVSFSTFQRYIIRLHTAMATHPTGETVDIVGINCGDNGRSCEEFPVCGDALKHDSLVRIRSEQMMIEGVEQAVMSVFWVMDGVDRCRVGFLPKHFLRYKQAYDGRLAQIIQFLAKSDSPGDRAKSHRNHGVARAVLVDTVPKEQIVGEEDRKKLLKDAETKDKENEGVVSIERSPKRHRKSDA